MRTASYPAPVPPWTTNEDRRLHFHVRAARIKEWHDAAYWIAKQQGWNHPSENNRPSTVRVTVTYPTQRIRDNHNLVGTVVKATIDGLVAAGVWPNDDPRYVTVLEPRIVVKPGHHQVTIELEERP